MNSNTFKSGIGSKIAAFAIASLVALGGQMTQANAQETADGEDSSVAEAPVITEMTLGPADAAVTIIEYASFTCPHCANFHKNQFKDLKKDYIDTGKVQFIYRDVYFDRFGLWASMVARCGGSDRFFGITDILYDQQRDWLGGGQDDLFVVSELRKIVKVAGLDDAALDTCLADNAKAKALVEWFQTNAEADAVRSTPTLVINGTTHSNMSYGDLKDIIDEELGS